MAENPQNTTEKILCVVKCMKAYHVGTEQALEEIATPFGWHEAKDFIVRKRDMQEKPDREIG